jgi:peroxiredoxin
MTLQKKLSAMKARFEAGAPAETVAIMHRATEELRSSGLLERTLKAGDKAPDFTLPNERAEIIASADLLRNGPLVVAFFRGVWWPYCNAELAALQKALPEFTSAGAILVAISPQLVNYGLETVKKHKLAFSVLSDQGNKVARQFGLAFSLPDGLRQLYLKLGADLQKYNGDDSWTLPMPGRFVIDRSSIIRAAEVNPDYTVRPEPQDTIEALKAMRAEQ